LVNAVLRRAAGFDVAQAERIADVIERYAVVYAADKALCRMLVDQYGELAAQRMLVATLVPAPAYLRINTTRISQQEAIAALAKEEVRVSDTDIAGAVRVEQGRYIASPLLADGLVRVQSLAAQFAVAALDVAPHQQVLDCCAAPGGKALTAAQQMDNKGHIVALDIYPNRLELIEKQAALEKIDIVETRCADATTYKDDALFDRVLCDVPCSNYGEMASKPELRQKPPTAESLVKTQTAILQNGALQLRAGGRLVYSTCTLDKRENQAVVDAFLRKHENFRPVSLKKVPNHAQYIGQYVQFLPQNDYSEGFFIACLERLW
jgi:16S rRNA (cytosine967-C5)-methyltransferase